MKKLVKIKKIEGTVDAPVSKSVLQRLFAVSMFSKTPVTIKTKNLCKDSMTALNIIEEFGVGIKQKNNFITIKPKPIQKKNNIILNCHESGLCLRMFSAISSVFENKITINGAGTLLRRPIKLITDSLNNMGLEVNSNMGKLPISIRGKINRNEIEIDGSVSSQFLTGLLLALPVLKQDVKINVKNLNSTSYIDLTLEILKMFNISISHENYSSFDIKGNQIYSSKDEVIIPEGDYSGSAFIMVAGAVGGKVQINGLNKDSKQGDKKIIDVLKKCGASISARSKCISIKKHKLLPFSFDATHCPDLFPPLATLASFCKGVSKIKGVSRLIHKESNREKALLNIFRKMGIKIETENDLMIVQGGAKRACEIDSFDDHRIAMAGAIASIGVKNGIVIHGSEVIAKSYPDFYHDIESLGVLV